MSVPFLLEIGCEEIPDWMIVAALKNLQELLEKLIAEHNLGGKVVWTDATPRRLVVYIEDLIERQADSEEVVMGPPKSAGAGAAAGFAKKMGVPQESLKTVKTIGALKTSGDRPTEEVKIKKATVKETPK